MRDFQSPDGVCYKWEDIKYFMRMHCWDFYSGKHIYLAYAAGACLENPSLLQDEKALLKATHELLTANESGRIPPLSKLKTEMLSAIRREWCKWLWCDSQSCPKCPIPLIEFIARITEALDAADLDAWEQREMLWREYKGARYGFNVNSCSTLREAEG